LQHIASVNVQHNQSLERDSVLLRELSAHNADNVIDLRVVQLQVLFQSSQSFADAFVDEGGPVEASDCKNRLSWLLLDPFAALNLGVSFQGVTDRLQEYSFTATLARV
jgi:hypothetical protein